MHENNLDLNEVAEALSHAPTDAQVEYKRLLIRAGRKAILPLAKSLIAFCDGKRALLEMQARFGSFTTQEDKELLPYSIAKSYVEHIVPQRLTEIVDLVPRLGKFVYPEAFLLLFHDDLKVRLAIALIISADTQMSPLTMQMLALFVTALEEENYEPKVALWLVRVALAKGGSQSSKAVFDAIATENKVGFDEIADEIIRGAILELSDLKDFVNEQAQ